MVYELLGTKKAKMRQGSTCKCFSFCAASHILCADMYSEISVQVSMTLMLKLMLEIASSLVLS